MSSAGILEHIKGLLDNNKINEADLKSILKQLQDEKSVVPFIDSILLKYKKLATNTEIKCPQSWRANLTISTTSLKEVCSEIESDLRIILMRRKELVGKDEKTGSPRLARSKIAGVTTFRLARAHIIHMNPDCVSCNDDRIKRGDHRALSQISIPNWQLVAVYILLIKIIYPFQMKFVPSLFIPLPNAT